MKVLPFLLLALVAGAGAPAVSAHAAPLSPSGLAKAAREAKLAEIDPSSAAEHGDETIESWLRELTQDEARSITWSGGACRLVRPEVARDAGGSDARCGHATIRLKHPRNRSDVALIEVYFDKPQAGTKPVPYAFRGSVELKDGEGYARFTREFESAWRERFPAATE